MIPFIYSPAPREAIAARFDPLQAAKLAGAGRKRQVFTPGPRQGAIRQGIEINRFF
jgi:hypothetical protein